MIDQLRKFVTAHPRLLVLTGAGCSAASGIPTYRDNQGNWQRSNPIRHQEFTTSLYSRKRYWARSYVGWPAVRDARPNAAHQALAALEARGLVRLLVTQNVDRLHQQAGSRQVVDLHGRLDEVLCLDCGHVSRRDAIQQRLAALNPHLGGDIPHYQRAPDGDADVADQLVQSMRVPDCQFCGGILKPNVVFFGDSVDRNVVSHVLAELESSDALLVVGSSLKVFSGFRFCRHAAQRNKPVVCINAGLTRADELFRFKVAGDCGEVLPALDRALGCCR